MGKSWKLYFLVTRLNFTCRFCILYPVFCLLKKLGKVFALSLIVLKLLKYLTNNCYLYLANVFT